MEKQKFDINPITKTILQPAVDKNFQDYIWQAVINPARAMEARAWVSKNPDRAGLLKGSKGESILHWAVQSEYGFVLESLNAGISANVKDDAGLTPMDWLANRLWYTVVEKDESPITKLRGSPLELEGILRIKAQTEELGILLMMRGGKTTDVNPNAIHGGEAWVRANLWNMIVIKKEREGIDGLRNWGESKKCAIHSWILSDENFEKHKAIKEWLSWGLNIDEPDSNGRTPLWYAVESWIYDDSWSGILKPAIQTLLQNGADPNAEDEFGESPATLLVKDYAKAEMFEEMRK